jgi:hypothetical protein
VTGGWRSLYNKELYNLHSSSKIGMIESNKIRWAEHVPCMAETRNAYKILVWKPEGRILLGRPRCR